MIASCTDKTLVFPPVMDALTRGYCGSCHMAYQPSMLPAASWDLMMNELDRHFEAKVELKPSVREHIRSYLMNNAADSELSGRAGQTVMQGLTNYDKPQRITSTPYFIEEHRFLSNRILDEWVMSEANCAACHVGACVGDYRI